MKEKKSSFYFSKHVLYFIFIFEKKILLLQLPLIYISNTYVAAVQPVS